MKKTHILFLFGGLLIPFFSFSQTAADYSPLKPDSSIIAEFDTNTFSLTEGGIFSSVLKVTNTNHKEVSFRVSVAYPSGWKSLTNLNKVYKLPAKDTTLKGTLPDTALKIPLPDTALIVLPPDTTKLPDTTLATIPKPTPDTMQTDTGPAPNIIYIPIRIIPLGKIKGNTKYHISAYLLSEDGVPLTMSQMHVSKEKFTNWDINIGPTEKIYFMNDSSSADFSLNVLNTGNETQEIFLDLSNYRKDIMLTDTNDLIVKQPYFTANLLQLQDTTYYFKIKTLRAKRNYRIVDTEGYRPLILTEKQSYTIFFRSSESRLSGSGSVQKAKKADFIKLPNTLKVNPFRTNVLPVTLDANASNLLGTQPILNVLLRGMTRLNNGAMLNYFSQYNFTTHYASQNFLNESFHYIGYFTDKIQVQGGDIGGLSGGGVSVGGKGLSIKYNFNLKHSAGAFYTQGPRLFNPTRSGYGFLYSFTQTPISITTFYTRLNSIALQMNTDYAGINSGGSFLKKHTVSGNITGIRTVSSSFNRFGFQISTNYNGRFLNDRINSNMGVNYFSPFSDPFNQGSVWSLNHSSSMIINNKWNANINNNYNQSLYIPVVSQQLRRKSSFLSNQFAFSTTVNNVSFGQGGFYNITTTDDTILIHSRGIFFNTSASNFDNSIITSANIRVGYNKMYRPVSSRDFFFLQFFTFARYRVLSINIRYNYGLLNIFDPEFLKNTDAGIVPQDIGVAANYQYQFPNPQFVLHNYLNYSHFTRFSRHSFGYTPEIYFFTNSGWRFRVMAGYYLTSSSAAGEQIIVERSTVQIKTPERTTSSSFILNAGIRKEFGIPIPFSKKKYFSLTFKAFVDLNGNDTLDNNEATLDNIVIRVDQWEAISNSSGEAKILNIPPENYLFSVFSLTDLKGFFPNIKDTLYVDKDQTIYVPFVKGAKIFGNVFIDREKLSPDAQFPLDLSGIKISAGIVNKYFPYHTLTEKDGAFQFYVPVGKYVLTMDERVLGERFTLLQNNIELDLDKTTENIYVSFFIVERRRKVTLKKFHNGNGHIIKDSTKIIESKPKLLDEYKRDNGQPGSSTLDALTKEGPIDKSLVKFRVQIGVYGKPNPSTEEIIKSIDSIPEIEKSKTEEGLTRYTSKTFKNYSEANQYRQEILKKGLQTDTTFIIIVGDYKGKILTADEAEQILKY